MIVRKPGEYELSLGSDGTVSFSVRTEDGVFTAASPLPLTAESWHRVSGTFEGNRVSVSVNGIGSADAASTGSIVPGTEPVVIGEFFQGNIDSVVFCKEQSLTGDGGFVRLTGADENGEVLLDASGHASVTLESTGNLSSDAFGREIVVHVKASPENEGRVRVVPKKWYAYLYNLGRGFVWGDAEGIEGTAGDFAAGMAFGIGDARDILKNLGYLWPGGEDPDWAIFGFAVLGLATEFAPGIGELPDAVITAVKVILPKIKNGPFRRGLIRIVKEMLVIARSKGPNAAVRYAKDYAGLLKAIVLKGSDAIKEFDTFVKCSGAIKNAVKLHRVMGDEIVDVLVRISKNPGLGADTVGRFLSTLGHGVDDAVLQSIRNSDKFDDAMDGVAHLLNKQVNSESLKKVLANDNVFTDTYKQADLLADSKRLVENSPDVKGLDKHFNVLGKGKDTGILGVTFELRCASKLSGGENIIELIDKGGIDLVTSKAVYQIKKTAHLVYGKGSHKAKAYLGKIQGGFAKQTYPGKPFNLILQKGEKAKFIANASPDLLNWMNAKSIEIIEVPF